MHKQSVGFIGLGTMGMPMAHNLAAAGFNVFAYSRNTERFKAIKNNAITCVASIPDLAQQVEIIISCVSDDVAVKDVLIGDNGVACSAVIKSANKPRIIIDCSTIEPQTAVRISSYCQNVKIQFLDAPVSGGDIGAKNGTLTFMVGGNQEVLDEVTPILEAMGKKIVHTGQVGSGQMTKAVNQLIVALTVTAMTEGLVLAERVGLDLEKTLSILQSGAAGSWTLDNYAPRVLDGNLEPGFSALHMLKDLNIALSEADLVQTLLPASKMVRDLYLSFVSNGGARLGNHGLIELYRKMLCNTGEQQ